MSVGKIVGVATGIVTLIGATVSAAFYYQTDEEAQRARDRMEAAAAASHAALATYDEIGKLELELANTELEITFILGITEHRPLAESEVDRLEYLRVKRVNIEERLRDLQSQGGSNG